MDDRLTLNSLYGGGRKRVDTKSKEIDKKKAYSPKSSSSKKNSFSHYDPKEDNKGELTDSDKWRKQNRILQAELNDIKKSLEQMKRTNAELKRELELLQQ